MDPYNEHKSARQKAWELASMMSFGVSINFSVAIGDWDSGCKGIAFDIDLKTPKLVFSIADAWGCGVIVMRCKIADPGRLVAPLLLTLSFTSTPQFIMIASLLIV
jgi:hypothetical protein